MTGEIFLLPFLDLLPRTYQGVVGEAFSWRHEKLAEGVEIVLWCEVSVEDGPWLDLTSPRGREVDAVGDGVVALLGGEICVVDRHLTMS